jgi:LysM repeat protein
MINRNRMILFFLLATAVFTACTAAPETVEVTRVVTEQFPVTVEVTRVVPQPVTIEKVVEVTRVVEVVMVATPTPDPALEATAAVTETAVVEPTLEPTPAASPTPVEGSYYTVRTGDSLSGIALKTGASEEAIMAANNLANANIISVGQELLIPGWSGDTTTTVAADPAQPAAPGAVPAQPAAPVGVNLLPNPSFEEDWYFFQGVSEWQLPNGWSFSADEGANNQGSGGRFFRPEVRLLQAADLPPAEQSLFVLDGAKTIKAFKGDAPTSFAIFRDVALQPGTYRLTIRFVPDSVSGYSAGVKVYNGDPTSAEARVIVGGGGTGWAGTNVGNQNTITHDFTLDTAQTIRLGGAFRNRYEQSNNGWFIDDWSLQQLETP